MTPEQKQAVVDAASSAFFGPHKERMHTDEMIQAAIVAALRELAKTAADWNIDCGFYYVTAEDLLEHVANHFESP